MLTRKQIEKVTRLREQTDTLDTTHRMSRQTYVGGFRPRGVTVVRYTPRPPRSEPVRTDK